METKKFSIRVGGNYCVIYWSTFTFIQEYLFKHGAEGGHRLRTRSEIENKLNENTVQLVRIQGSPRPGKPGSIMEF